MTLTSNRSQWWQRPLAWACLSGILLTNSQAVWAKDPFRSGSDARPIAPEVESAFREFFCAGRYTGSRAKLDAALKAAPQEPIVYALLAALSFQEGNLEQFAQLATQTRQVAVTLKPKDPLRGALYEAIGSGMEAANLVVREGVVIGLPKALPILNQVFGSIREAQKIDGNDPELNLFSGYMDLMLTNRDKALTQFQKAAPAYMSYRGQALTYRDMGKNTEALSAVDQAISTATATSCDNPELYYLKAQVLAAMGNDKEAVPLFDRALSAAQQLPDPLVSQIRNERTGSANRLSASGGSPPGSPSPKP